MNYSSKQHYLGNAFAYEGAAEDGAEGAISSPGSVKHSQVPVPQPIAPKRIAPQPIVPQPIVPQPNGQIMDSLSLDEQTGKKSFDTLCGTSSQIGSQSGKQPYREDSLIMSEELQEKSSGDREQFDPHAVWQMLLSELALQMPSATFNTWVRDTWVVAYEDGEFIIGLPNAYARDWLENRLRNKIKRALSSFIYRSVQVQFLVRPRTVSDAADAKPVPLYATTGADAQQFTGHASANNSLADSAAPATPVIAESTPIDPASIDTDIDLSQNSFSRQTAASRGIRESSNRDYNNVASDREQFSYIQKETKSESTTQRSGQQPNSRLGQEWANSDGRTDYYADNTPPIGKIPLNGQYTFETFVVGSHNKLAHAAAEAISEKPGQSFNPLFVYGGVGLGKTHLLHSIGHRAKQLGHHMLYVSSEQFTNELIGAIRSQSTEEFRNKYRQVDILLIDDIQFISGKESTQEEFFHTFNHLHASGKQVVLSSDRPPKMLATLDDRLRSRFEGGLQTDIAQPDFETRVAILQSKANRMAAAVDQSVLMMVAERVDSNIRELEGALNRLIVQARLMQSSLTLQLATSILDNLAPERTICAPDRLLRIVAEHFQLTPADLCGRKRTKEVAGARQIAMYFLREEHGLSLPAIGALLGGRDHSTVRYGIEKVNGDLTDDETLRQTISALREKMYIPF